MSGEAPRCRHKDQMRLVWSRPVPLTSVTRPCRRVDALREVRGDGTRHSREEHPRAHHGHEERTGPENPEHGQEPRRRYAHAMEAIVVASRQFRCSRAEVDAEYPADCLRGPSSPWATGILSPNATVEVSRLNSVRTATGVLLSAAGIAVFGLTLWFREHGKAVS
jgi:hypothetical protein